MKKIIISILIIAVLVIGAVAAFEIKARHDQSVEQQGYANALNSMKQTGHDEHSTDYMNPKKDSQ